jgi:hypothetical protein
MPNLLPFFQMPFLLHLTNAAEVFRHGGSALEREISLEAKGKGYGGQSAAITTLGLPGTTLFHSCFYHFFSNVPTQPSL